MGPLLDNEVISDEKGRHYYAREYSCVLRGARGHLRVTGRHDTDMVTIDRLELVHKKGCPEEKNECA